MILYPSMVYYSTIGQLLSLGEISVTGHLKLHPVLVLKSGIEPIQLYRGTLLHRRPGNPVSNLSLQSGVLSTLTLFVLLTI